MKEIEERAEEYVTELMGMIDENKPLELEREHFAKIIEETAIAFATEQKAIDDEELGKALLYCTNKTTERVKREMIDKACEWQKKYCGMNESGLVQFRKAMEG